MIDKEKMHGYTERVKSSLKSTRGRSVLTYLMFVGISFVFWIIMSLDSEIQREFDVPLAIEELPDSVTLISNCPATLSVSVKGKGSQMFRYMFGTIPAMKLRFDKNVSTRDNRFVLSRANLDTRLRDYFGAGVSIISCRPDSISLYYTTNPGEKLPLKLQYDVKAALQYVISGPITCNVDSVKVYSVSDLPASVTEIETQKIVKAGLKDTVRYDVKVKPIAGTRIVPDHVIVTVPVEPLISKKLTVPIEVVNAPDKIGLLTFPSQIDVTYLVPMSSYNESYPVRVYVDYNSLEPGMTKLPLSLSIHPGIAKDAVLSMDSVEYVLEKQ